MCVYSMRNSVASSRHSTQVGFTHAHISQHAHLHQHAHMACQHIPIQTVHVRPTKPKLDLADVRAAWDPVETGEAPASPKGEGSGGTVPGSGSKLPLRDAADHAVWTEARRVFARRIADYWVSPVRSGVRTDGSTAACPPINVDSEAFTYFNAAANNSAPDSLHAGNGPQVCTASEVLPVACAKLVGMGPLHTAGVAEADIEACVRALGDFKWRTTTTSTEL